MISETKMRKQLHKMILLSACIMICIMALGFGILKIYNDSYRTSLKENMIGEVDNYENRIYRQLRRDFKLLNSLSTMIGDSNIYNQSSFKQILLNTNKDNDFIAMSFFGCDGTGFTSVREKEEVFIRDINTVKGEIQKVATKAMQGEQVISNIFTGELSNQRVVMLGVPVFENGKIIGCLTATDEIEVFSEIIKGEPDLLGTGYMHLLNNKGEYLIRGSNKVVEEKVNSIFDGPYISDDKIKYVKRDMKKGKTISFNFIYKNKSYEALLSPMELNGWYLLCIQSMALLEGSFDVLRLGMIVFFLITFIVLSTVLFMGYRVIKKNNKKLNELAYYDPLTGLHNMFGFTEKIKSILYKTDIYGIIVINIRKFKFINEVFGKIQADELLCLIADTIQDNLGEEDCACRESGDTFYIYFSNADEKILYEKIQSIILQIEQSQKVHEHEYSPVFRCGCALGNRNQDLQTVLTHAMFALERTKKYLNKNIWIFDEQLHEQEKMTNYVEQHAQEAIDKQLFKLYLQPKVNLTNNRVSSAEALVRWQQEDGKIIFPGDFISIYEQNGFCVKLDLYMFEQACKALRSWIDQGLSPIGISINQSKITVFESNYMESLKNLLNRYQVPANLITIEILEGFTIENIDDLNMRLDQLHEIGFRISMDDFGSGYSSLNVLGKLHIDELKIDREFLLSATDTNDSRNGIIMEDIIKLSQKLSISTVVEGVETVVDDMFIKDIGCDLGQGYLYSRPIPAMEFTDKFIKKEYVFGQMIRNTNHLMNNISMTAVASILKNSNVGIWTIEIPTNQNELPRMSANQNMLILLGVTEILSCEDLYTFWYKRIHPVYISYVQEVVTKIIEEGEGEVEYPWHHPTKGWIYVRCGGYIHNGGHDCYRMKGYHQIIERLLQKNGLLYSDDFMVFDRLRLHKYSDYYMDIYDELCEIDINTNQVEWIFEMKNRYLQHEYHEIFQALVEKRIHPQDHSLVFDTFDIIKNKQLNKSIVSVRTKTMNGFYTWVRLVFVYGSFSKRNKVLMSVINIQEEKASQELRKNREVILSLVAENDILIYDVDFIGGKVLSLYGENRNVISSDFTIFKDIVTEESKDFLNPERIREFLDISNIQKVLETNEPIYLDIQKNNKGFVNFMSGWYRITLTPQTQLKDHVIIMVKKIDRNGIVSNVIQQYTNQNFEVIYSIDCKNDTFTKFSLQENTEQLHFIEGASFIQSCRSFISNYGVEKEKAGVLKEFDYDHLLQMIEQNIVYSFEFGAYDLAHQFHQKKIYFHLYDRENQVILMMVVDVTDQYMQQFNEKQRIEQLEKRATVDGLTGLHNRYYFEKAFHYYVDGEGRYQESAFLLVDLDNFKQLNDTYGHLIGDKALQAVASGLKTFFRSTDIISRFGGDEFVVLMKHIRGKEVIDPLMERFLQTMDEIFDSEPKYSQLHISVGISLIPRDGFDFMTLYQKADQALYEVKKNGKHNYQVYEEKDDESYEE